MVPVQSAATSMQPRLNVRQLIRPLVNKYEITQVDNDQIVAVAQQKRLAFKEKVTFYSDQAQTTPTFSFRAEKVMDVHGRYFVEDENGASIGSFKKEFKKSLVNSTWVLFDASGQQRYVVNESNQTVAMARRYVGWIPIIGEIMELATNFIKYHFQFTDIASGDVSGMYKKTALFRDRYQLMMTDEAYDSIDWRVYAAFCVALDALQSR